MRNFVYNSFGDDLKQYIISFVSIVLNVLQQLMVLAA